MWDKVASMQSKAYNKMAGQSMPPPPQGQAMNPGPGMYSPWGNNPQPVQPPGGGMPPPPGMGDMGAGAQQPSGGNFSGWNPSAVNQYGGQQIAGADPSQADYQSVQGYADAAYENSQRYMAPQHAQQNRRMDQELINKGIDPNSAQGKEMQNMLAMQQGDQQNAAQFGAMQFGQGIQNQMAQQEQQKAQLAGQMQSNLWGNQLGASGQNLDWQKAQMQNDLGWGGLNNQYALGMGQIGLGHAGLQNQFNMNQANNETNRYGMDLGHQLGMGQLDLGRGAQEWKEMQDMWGNQFDTKSYNDQMDLMRYALMNQNMGGQAPSWGQVDPSSPYGSDRGTPSGGTTIGWKG